MMSDFRGADEPVEPGPEGAEEDLEELRRLIIGSREVGDVLPEAIIHRSRQDHQIAKALGPTIEDSIHHSIEKNKQGFVDAIFPIMGPAIRRAVADALRGLVQSINQTLSHSFSLQGVKWRFEAWRTGKSFGEIVLLNTLGYRVEQVFLIHRETGLLLHHVNALEEIEKDADMISGMLTAIQDFVHDSFSVEQGDVLETMRVGELNVWVEPGPRTVLACVIRGEAPVALRETMQDVQETLYLQMREELSEFAGDIAPFESCRPELKRCLHARVTETDARRRSFPFFWMILAVVVIVLGVFFFLKLRERARWDDYVRALRGEKGIVVTEAGRQDGKYIISGLRDPLAGDPGSMLDARGLDPDGMVARWEPYHALDPSFVLKRSRSMLRPPTSVTLELVDGTLYVRGHAGENWAAEAKILGRAVPGVLEYNDSGLTIIGISELRDVRQKLESAVVRFEMGTAELVPGQDELLDELVENLTFLQNAAGQLNRQIRVILLGHASSEGSSEVNRALSQERADTLLALLKREEAVAALPLVSRGAGAGQPVTSGVSEEERSLNRSVTLVVEIQDHSL